MKKDIILTSGEYTYYKNAPEVGRIIDGVPTGHGNDGKVILYDRKHVMKLWYDQDSILELRPDIKEEYVQNIKSLNEAKYPYRYIYMPKNLVIYKNAVVGYLLLYFKGRNLDILSDLLSFKAFLLALMKLEKELLIFSKEGFKLNDVHAKNLMVLQKHKIVSFALIDPDPWQKSNDNARDLYKHNINEIRNILLEEILTENLKEFIDSNPNLKMAYKLIEENQSEELQTFLSEMQRVLEADTHVRIKTIGDFRNI